MHVVCPGCACARACVRETHRQGLVEVVEDGDRDREDLAALDGGREGQVGEEGREGGDGRPLGQPDALLRVGAHGLAHPLRDRVRELQPVLDDPAGTAMAVVMRVRMAMMAVKRITIINSSSGTLTTRAWHSRHGHELPQPRLGEQRPGRRALRLLWRWTCAPGGRGRSRPCDSPGEDSVGEEVPLGAEAREAASEAASEPAFAILCRQKEA